MKVTVLIAQHSDKSGFKIVKAYVSISKAIKDCDILREHGDMSKDYFILTNIEVDETKVEASKN